MKYIIKRATITVHFDEEPGLWSKRCLYRRAREAFEEVENIANKNGTWYIWNQYIDDEASARAEFERIKATETDLTYALISPRTGFEGFSETAFKLIADNEDEDEDDSNRFKLLDWYAESFKYRAEK